MERTEKSHFAKVYWPYNNEKKIKNRKKRLGYTLTKRTDEKWITKCNNLWMRPINYK